MKPLTQKQVTLVSDLLRLEKQLYQAYTLLGRNTQEAMERIFLIKEVEEAYLHRINGEEAFHMLNWLAPILLQEESDFSTLMKIINREPQNLVLKRLSNQLEAKALIDTANFKKCFMNTNENLKKHFLVNNKLYFLNDFIEENKTFELDRVEELLALIETQQPNKSPFYQMVKTELLYLYPEIGEEIVQHSLNIEEIDSIAHRFDNDLYVKNHEDRQKWKYITVCQSVGEIVDSIFTTSSSVWHLKGLNGELALYSGYLHNLLQTLSLSEIYYLHANYQMVTKDVYPLYRNRAGQEFLNQVFLQTAKEKQMSAKIYYKNSH